MDSLRRPLVQIDNVEVRYPTGAGWFATGSWVRAVDGVTLSIYPRESVALVGESGSGKSTLGRALVRLRRPSAGRIVFDGQDLGRLSGRAGRALSRRIQMVFQDAHSSLDPRMRIGDSIAEPLVIQGMGSDADRSARVGELLARVGLGPEVSRRYPHEFSGGQRQRIVVARALAAGPEFVVLDEPVSSLDVCMQAQVLNLLSDLRRQLGLTYLLIAHDLAVVRLVSDRVAVMYLGRLMELGMTAELFARPMHPYTRALLSAIPVPAPKRARSRQRIILAGDLPSPAAPPSGCRFHTRCWLYEALQRPERCRTEQPPMTPITETHASACHFSDRLPAEPGDVEVH